jgi:hypothetical protein
MLILSNKMEELSCHNSVTINKILYGAAILTSRVKNIDPEEIKGLLYEHEMSTEIRLLVTDQLTPEGKEIVGDSFKLSLKGTNSAEGGSRRKGVRRKGVRRKGSRRKGSRRKGSRRKGLEGGSGRPPRAISPERSEDVLEANRYRREQLYQRDASRGGKRQWFAVLLQGFGAVMGGALFTYIFDGGTGGGSAPNPR